MGVSKGEYQHRKHLWGGIKKGKSRPHPGEKHPSKDHKKGKSKEKGDQGSIEQHTV